MTEPERRNGWQEYQLYVLSELKHLTKETDDQSKELHEIREHLDTIHIRVNKGIIEVEKLKARAAAWGTMSGIIAGGAISLLTQFLLRKS